MTPRERLRPADPNIPDHCSTITLQRVCVGETDMMGVVHHANYVSYCEKGRLEYLRRRGLPYKVLVERGLHMPVIDLHLRYRRPALFDDLLSVETRLGALTRVTARFDYQIRRADPDRALPAELLVEGQVLLACIGDKQRPRALPEDLADRLFMPENPGSGDPRQPW
jgi:acyl-CoA thioester hydrolase